MEKDLYRGRREDPKAGPRAPDKTGKVISSDKMKRDSANILNKAFKEAKEKQEYDYEGDMAMSQLKSIIANAQRIHDMLERDTNIPEWVQSKITLAEDYITTASNYMQGEMSEEAPVNVAANVADPKNKRLFGQPMKRFKNFKAK
jgi:serine protease inhibitor